MKCEKTKHAKDKGPQPSFFVNTLLCKSKDKKYQMKLKTSCNLWYEKKKQFKVLKSMANVLSVPTSSNYEITRELPRKIFIRIKK